MLDLCQDLKIKKNPSKKTRKALKESVENQLFSQLVDQTNPRPVETGSDWDIPSRFSFQPVAPRKNLDCMTPPTVSSDWLCAATQGSPGSRLDNRGVALTSCLVQGARARAASKTHALSMRCGLD